MMSRQLSAEELKGMTVNERLFATGLFDEYDQAIDARDEKRLREVLSLLYIGDENIEAIIKTKIPESDQ